MSDKIFVPLKDYAEINAAMPCLANIAMPGMNFVFSTRSLLTAKTISLQKCCCRFLTGYCS